MKRVAFVTCSSLPALIDDDRHAARVLESRGDVVDAVPWDAASVDWAVYDAAVIRSAWNYHHQPARYDAWLAARETDGTPLWNRPGDIRANMDKRYLLDFERAGIPIVPTVHLPAAAGRVLAREMSARGLDRAVVKPAVSANAWGTWLTSGDAAADQQRFETQAASVDLLLQPYLPEVAAEGEWSLMFFDGTFSHAVLKRPAAGEFRVQEDFGGGAALAEAPARLVADARAVLEAAGGPFLYARVDGIRREGRFLLMELEINEPTLFLSLAPGAAERFAAAIERVSAGKCG